MHATKNLRRDYRDINERLFAANVEPAYRDDLIQWFGASKQVARSISNCTAPAVKTLVSNTTIPLVVINTQSLQHVVADRALERVRIPEWVRLLNLSTLRVAQHLARLDPLLAQLSFNLDGATLPALIDASMSEIERIGALPVPLLELRYARAAEMWERFLIGERMHSEQAGRVVREASLLSVINMRGVLASRSARSKPNVRKMEVV